MTVSNLILLLRLLVWAIQTVKEAYDSLTPEQKAEVYQDYLKWQAAIKKVQDPMEGSLDGP